MTQTGPQLPLGASARPDGSCSFCVWAPLHESIRVHIHGGDTHALERDDDGYHTGVIGDVAPGTRYTYVLPDGRELPDPASRHQPDGVHGPSEVVPRAFEWAHDRWPQPRLQDMVLYELHVGTFTPQGTFDAVIPRLPELRDLGVNSIELMPIAQFPGSRNWGYDGTYAFAAQNSYGGPLALKRLVDAAHALEMTVALDVVYNHLGPEGNYLPAFAPYFTQVYQTPWGAALNFDEHGSGHVRRYFIESALQWTNEFRIDVLRLDAIHAIMDRSAQPFLRELADAVHDRAARNRRTVILVAESDLSDPRILRSERLGGMNLDAQWLDDVHHAVRTLLTGERTGYYADYGHLEHLARAFRHGYVYAGRYSAYRQRRHGAPGPDLLPRQFVVYTQNHDQVGNRMRGERPTTLLSPAQLRLAAASVLLSPFTPMLFMGEEYGEGRPFPYFVSHGDEELIEAVRTGRREEFASFDWQGEPPDPQAEETFRSAILNWSAREDGENALLLQLYTELLRLRRDEPAIARADAMTVDVLDSEGEPIEGDVDHGTLVVRRRAASQSSVLVLNFAAEPARLALDAGGGEWRCAVDTADERWGGDGSTVPDECSATAELEIAPFAAVLLLHDEAHGA